MEYLPYVGGVLLLAALAAWIYMLVKRFKPYRKVVAKTKELYPYKEDILFLWESFLMEYRLKMKIAYVPPGPKKEAEELKREVISELNEVIKHLEVRESRVTIKSGPYAVKEYLLWEVKFPQLFWRYLYYPARDVLRAITLPIWLSFPSNRAEKLQRRASELDELLEKTKKALSSIVSLEKSSRFLTTKENKRHHDTFARKLHERDIQGKRNTIARLKAHLRRQIGYIMTRQQEKSLAIGEPSISRGLQLLDFQKAKETWENEIQKVEALEEDEYRLDDAIEEYQGLSISFQMEKVEEHEQPLTYIERRALRIKDEISAFGRLEEDLEELEQIMGIKTQFEDDLDRANELFETAADHWSKLEWEDLRETMGEIGTLLATISNRNSVLREWVRFIIPMRDKIVWLDEAVISKLELQNLEVEENKSWQTVKKKLDHDVPKYWAVGNEESLNELIAEVKSGIEIRQQRLATMAYQKSQEMELDPEVSDKAVRTLKHLHNIILQGPQDDAVSTPIRSMTQYEPKVRSTGKMVKTELGTTIPAELADSFRGTDARESEEEEEEQKSPHRRKSLLNGLKQAESYYYKKGG